MLKILYKILIIFSCCVVLLLLTVAPVSAEETSDYSSYQVDFTMQRPSMETQVLYLFGSDYATLTQTLDQGNFQQLISSTNSWEFTTRDINENQYFEYAAYQYNGDDADLVISNKAYGIFTYAFITDRVSLPFLQTMYTHVVMNSCFLQYYGINCHIDFVRFSIRNLYNDYVDTTAITTGSYTAKLFGEDVASNSGFGIQALHYYNPISVLSGIRFGRDDANNPPPLQYCFCIDFYFRPQDFSNMENVVSIGINTDSYFTLFNYTYGSEYGPQLPVSPSLPPSATDDNYYAPPSTGTYDDFTSLENLLEFDGYYNPAGAQSQYLDLSNAFKTDFSKLAVPLARVSSIMSRLTSGVPFVQFLINASLVLGLLAFFFGLGKAIIGASSDPRPDPVSDPVNRENSQRFARGLGTSKNSSGKLPGSSGSGSRSDVRFGSIGRLTRNNQ